MTHTHTQLRRIEERESRPNKRPWPQIAVMLFLLAQAAGYVLLDSLYLTTLEGTVKLGGTVDDWVTIIIESLFIVIALALAAASSLFALYSTLRRFPHAWMHSMLVQGIGMTIGLTLYFGTKPIITYPILIGSLAMVIYLMLPGVQVAFLRLIPPREETAQSAGSGHAQKTVL